MLGSRRRVIPPIRPTTIEGWTPNDTRGLTSVPTAIRMGYRLAHSAAGFHRRTRLLCRFHGGLILRDAAGDVSPHIEFLDEDLLGLFCDGRGVRHHHALPV